MRIGQFYKMLLPILGFGVAYLAFNLIDMGEHTLWVCPSRLFFGLECPGCGSTRAAMQIFTGHVWEGIKMNPNSVFVLVVAAMMALALIYDGAMLLRPQEKRRYMAYRLYVGIDKILGRWYILIPFILFEVGIFVYRNLCYNTFDMGLASLVFG